jgi:hypothetical protein
MNTEKITKSLKQDIKCEKGDFLKGEMVYLKRLPFGNFEVSSMDGLRIGYVDSHEVDIHTHATE